MRTCDEYPHCVCPDICLKCQEQAHQKLTREDVNSFMSNAEKQIKKQSLSQEPLSVEEMKRRIEKAFLIREGPIKKFRNKNTNRIPGKKKRK